MVRLVPCRIVYADSGPLKAGTTYKQKGTLKVLFKCKIRAWSSGPQLDSSRLARMRQDEIRHEQKRMEHTELYLRV